ncbi:MFS transporter [Chitinimonas viridis]|uniref:MFS transporter n=1 Tax=Chitinimonas viridis TaxID=664880 RepID=A0ABT8BBB1_9NEIS|nr:MFS transporter [Chitinimonas viridis]MDN3578881.1 MFS transporter [Chitinimonas viridis]
MLDGLRQRLDAVGLPFRALLLSDALMLLAMMVARVAVPWWIVHEGGAGHLALYAVVQAVVAFVSMPLLSPLGDRYSKRLLITLGLLIFAAEGAVLATLATLGIYHLWLVIALEALPVIAMSLILPASLSIAADLVPAERFADALALQKSAQAFGRLIGPVLGGTALAVSGTAAALWLHWVMVLAAAMLAWRIPSIARHPGEGGAKRWWRDLRAGLRATWSIPIERGRIAISFLVMVCFTPAVGMLVPLKVQSLGLSGAWLGACEAALSLGMLAGALGIAARLADYLGRYRAAIGGIMLEGLALALAGFTSNPYLLVICYAVTGVGLAMVMLVGQTHRMLAIPEDFRARIVAVSMMVMQIAGTLGPGLAGIALTSIPVREVYVVFGLAEFVFAFGYFLVPRYREFLALGHEEVRGWYGRQFPGAFRRAESDDGSPMSGKP